MNSLLFRPLLFCLSGAAVGLRSPFSLLCFPQLWTDKVTSLLATTAAPRPLAFPLFHDESGPFRTNSTQVPAPKLYAPAMPSHGACVPRQRAPLGSLGRRKKQLFLQQFPESGAKGKRQYAFLRVDYNTQNALLPYLCEVAPGHRPLRKHKVIHNLRTSLSSMHCLQEDSFFRRGLSSSLIGL